MLGEYRKKAQGTRGGTVYETGGYAKQFI